MAKITTAAQAAECNHWSILHQRSKFHLVITFHCRVTQLFKSCFRYPLQIQTFWNGYEKWTEKCDKILLLKKLAAETVNLMHEVYTDEKRLGDSMIICWHKAFSKGRKTSALLLLVRWPLGICTEETVNTVTAVVRENHHVTVWQVAQALDISKSCSYDSVQEVENVESCSLLCSTFLDSRIERPLYWDLWWVVKKNWGWVGCDGMRDYMWWELDSPFPTTHNTRNHALEVSAVSIKEESLSGEIDE